MPQNLWDTSALVKLYVTEQGSVYARGIADADDVVISAITVVEVAAALRRRTLADAAGFTVIDVTPDVRMEASRLLLAEPRVTGRLRWFDAVQLATANLWFQALRPITLSPGAFIVSDGGLAVAAAALGLPVDNPEEHE